MTTEQKRKIALEKIVTPVQKEVFIIIDEWWKRFGYSPTLREIAHQRGKPGVANTKKIVDRLVSIGVLKKWDKRPRTIRPVYLSFRELQ